MYVLSHTLFVHLLVRALPDSTTLLDDGPLHMIKRNFSFLYEVNLYNHSPAFILLKLAYLCEKLM